jgi:hypothetical protein
LRREYPSRFPGDLLLMFRRSLSAIHARAQKLGTSKDPETVRQMGRIYTQHPRAIAARFSKGHIPFNAGLRRPRWYCGRMRETQFKKGQMPYKTVPVGTLVRISGGHADGYLKRKIADSPGPGLSRFSWKLEHARIWEEANGPVPPNHAVVFKDGDKEHITLANLELVTRAELMSRNTIHKRRPPLLKEAIYALIAVKARITKKEKKDAKEKQAIGPARSPVRNARAAQGSQQADGDLPGQGHSGRCANNHQFGDGRSESHGRIQPVELQRFL